MTDIDFDELDKAVNSIMGNVNKEVSDTDSREKTFTISGTLKPGEKPAYSKLQEAAKMIGSETLIGRGEITTVVEDLHPVEEAVVHIPESKPVITGQKPISVPERVATPAARRPNSGRFMDVVRPSSDMKTTTGVGVAGITPLQKVDAPFAAMERVSPVTKPVVASHIPESDQTPLTPFLSDAKVEKRPLGGTVPAPAVSEDDAHEENAEKDKTAAGEDFLRESESDKEKDNFDNQKTIDATDIVKEQSDADRQLQAIESGHSDAVPEPEPSVETAHLEAKNPSMDEKIETTGDIYGVKSDHKPLGHPAKQKSGWGVVFGIISIIIVCVALGVAAYFILGVGI